MANQFVYLSSRHRAAIRLAGTIAPLPLFCNNRLEILSESLLKWNFGKSTLTDPKQQQIFLTGNPFLFSFLASDLANLFS